MSHEGAAAAGKDFWKFYWAHQDAPPDQRRKFLEMFHQNADIASVTREQWEKANAESTKWAAENPNLTMAQLERLHDSFDRLSQSMEGFSRSMQRAFGDSTATMIDGMSAGIKSFSSEIVALKQAWDAMPTWMGGGGKAVPGSPFQPLPQTGTAEHPFPEPPADKFSPASRFSGGYQPMSFETGGGGGAESTFSRGVYTGTLAALKEWYSSLQAGGSAAGGGGIVKASLGGSGGAAGARGWGGGGYGVMPNDATGEAGAAGGKPLRGGGPRWWW